MAFSFSPLTLLLFLGFGQALTVSAILIFRHCKKRQGDILLNILFFLTIYIYLSDLLIPSGLYRTLPFFMFTDFPVLFLVPPVLFLYVRKLLGNAPFDRRRWIDAAHFIPFAIILVTHLPLILAPFAEKIAMLEENRIPQPRLFGVDMTLLGLIQYFCYLVYSLYSLLRFRKDCAPGEDSRKAMTRLQGLLFFYFVIFLCLAAAFYNLLNYKYYPQRDFSFKRLILDFPLFVICGYNYFILLSGTSYYPAVCGSKGKYRKSVLTRDTARKLYASLCDEIERNRLWSDPDLDLRTLAELSGQTYHTLSQVINQTTGLNYHGFINQYRLREACRLLEQTDMSVLDIAFEAGFNSKATFNKVFKDEKSCTPTQYRLEHLKK